jgi:hypothetical protein
MEYSRISMSTWGSPQKDGDGTGSQSYNADSGSFGVASEDWGQRDVLALVDAASGGNLLMYGGTSISQYIFACEEAKVAAGSAVSAPIRVALA